MDPPADAPKAGAWTRRNIFFHASMVAALCVGGLQMFRVRGGLLTDYGADLLGTIWLYAMFRQGRTLLLRNRPLSAGGAMVSVFAGCTVSEFAQKLHWLPGVYDPVDILTYGLAVTAAYVCDRIFGPLV
jgi:uncharacterized membrane protein